MRFPLVLARVQNLVLDALSIEKLAQQFGLLDRHGTDQDRLADLVLFRDRLGDGLELVGGVLEELVVLVDALHRHVGRNLDHIHLVDVPEFGRFGRRRTGHAGQFGIHAEIVLERDRGERLVLRLDIDAFLRLDGLVEAIRPAATVHHAPGKFVDDDDLVVLHDIVGVALEHDVRFERLVQMMDDLRVFHVVEIVGLKQTGFLQHLLDGVGAFLGPGDVLRLFVGLVPFRLDAFDDGIDRDVEFRLVLCRAGNDQRGPRLVDQDRIDLVHDGVIEGPLHHLLAAVFHVVAQVIEAELVVRSVRDVGMIGLAPCVFGQVGHDDADRQAEETVDLPHPVGIARGEVIVDRDDVDALALDRVEVSRQRRDERLALARAHFRDLATVEDDTADHLDVEMPHSEDAGRCFAHGGESFGKNVVERLPVLELLAELGGLRLQLFVRERLDLVFETVDLTDDLPERADVAIVRRAEDGLRNSLKHGL